MMGMTIDQIEQERRQLIEQKAALSLSIRQIKDEIRRARQGHAATGVYADAEWYNVAQATLAEWQSQHDAAQTRLGELKILRRGAVGRPFGDVFVDLARRHLDRATFERLWTATEQARETPPEKDKAA